MSGSAAMSAGAEKRMETRLKKLEDMLKDPKSALNLESLLVSSEDILLTMFGGLFETLDAPSVR